MFNILPFYKFPIRQIIEFNINAALKKCISLKSIALRISMQDAFTIPDQFKKILSAFENDKAKRK